MSSRQIQGGKGLSHLAEIHPLGPLRAAGARIPLPPLTRCSVTSCHGWRYFSVLLLLLPQLQYQVPLVFQSPKEELCQFLPCSSPSEI